MKTMEISSSNGKIIFQKGNFLAHNSLAYFIEIPKFIWMPADSFIEDLIFMELG